MKAYGRKRNHHDDQPRRSRAEQHRRERQQVRLALRLTSPLRPEDGGVTLQVRQRAGRCGNP
jgi:hypothetical protein